MATEQGVSIAEAKGGIGHTALFLAWFAEECGACIPAQPLPGGDAGAAMIATVTASKCVDGT